MNRVGLWGVWLATANGAYSALIGYRWQWNPYFLVMMVIVGIMAATKKDAVVLETAIVVLGGVWAMLLFKRRMCRTRRGDSDTVDRAAPARDILTIRRPCPTSPQEYLQRIKRDHR